MLFNCIEKTVFLNDQVNLKELGNNLDGLTTFNQLYVLRTKNCIMLMFYNFIIFLKCI